MTATASPHRRPREQTPDEALARNLRRIREDRGLSRQGLADLLTRTAGVEWSRWRIVDLEGARTPDRPPVSPRWDEVIALCLALDVTVFELVLPTDPDTYVAVQYEPEELRQASGRSDNAIGHALTTEDYAQALFSLPSSLLSPERLSLAKEKRKQTFYTDREYLLQNYQFLVTFAQKIAQWTEELPSDLREGGSD